MTTPADALVSMLQQIRTPRRHVDRWIGAALLVLVALALWNVWFLDQRTKTTDFTRDDVIFEVPARTPAR